MIRIRFHLTPEQRGTILMLGLALIGVLLIGAVLVLTPAGDAKANTAAVFFPKGGGKHFYLTDANLDAEQASTTCTTGYHMASLWEILDVTDLAYDYDHPEAHTKADSGFGPPSYWYGWVRTGWNSSSANTAGIANCNSWSSTSASNYGSIVRLSRTWETNSGEIFTWDAATWQCSGSAPVWCVGDFYEVSLPLIVKSN